MNTRVIHLPQYKHLFFILLAISLLSLGLYVFGIHKTVRNVVEREMMETELTHLTAEIGEKEFAYIALKNKINLEMAYAMGFEQTEAELFVSRDSSVALAGGASQVR
jgi:hypothetical protein